MRIKFICAAILLLSGIISKNITLAQTNAIPWSSFNNGFTVTTSTNTSVTSVVGQNFVGSIQQGNTRIESGFLAAPAILSFIPVGENGDEILPSTYRLYQNYPNPFNPSTTIQFAIPKLSKVTLKIIDVLGKEVVMLVDEKLPAGEYKVIFDMGTLPSGVYFYQLQAEEFSATKKLLLVK